MLFILAINLLHHILCRAPELGTLQPLGDTPIHFRVSLYIDDAAVFVDPHVGYIRVITKILDVFGDATGLKIMFTKMEIFTIRCDED